MKYSFENAKYPTGNSKVTRILNLFYMYRTHGLFWFRFFITGYGLEGKRIKANHPILFSERYGYTKYYKLFGWKFKILKPHNP